MPIHRNYSRYDAETTIYKSLEEFLSSTLQNDVSSIQYGTSFLDLLVVDRHAATTIVVFHAAVDPAKTSLPVFIGMGMVEHVDANIVFISEPALDLGVPIGWYAGDESRPLQKDLSDVIRHIQNNLPAAEHLAFFGASAGGFAALYYSNQFPESLAVVANPQTNILKYHPGPVEKYKEVCWSGKDLPPEKVSYDLVELYAGRFDNFVVYLQNKDDDLHVSDHFSPWSKATKQFQDRWRVLIGDWGEGHAPVPAPLLTGILGFAAEVNGDWTLLLEDEVLND